MSGAGPVGAAAVRGIPFTLLMFSACVLHGLLYPLFRSCIVIERKSLDPVERTSFAASLTSSSVTVFPLVRRYGGRGLHHVYVAPVTVDAQFYAYIYDHPGELFRHGDPGQQLLG